MTLHKERIGIRIGESLFAYHASWPLASIAIQDDELTLSYPFKTIRLDKQQVDKCVVSSKRGLLQAIEIVQKTPNSQYIIWCKDAARLLNALELAGYPVS